MTAPATPTPLASLARAVEYYPKGDKDGALATVRDLVEAAGAGGGGA